MKGKTKRAIFFTEISFKEGYKGSFESAAHGDRATSVSILIKRNKLLVLLNSLYLSLAPHTSGPRDVSRCGALSLLQKDAALQGDPAETAVG